MSLITKTAELAAKALPDRNADEMREARRIIGRDWDRVDGFEKVTGAAKFAAEPRKNVAQRAPDNGRFSRF